MKMSISKSYKYQIDNINYLYKMQQNKAAAEASSVSPQLPWNATEIAAPQPCNSAIRKITGKQIYLKDKPETLILLQAAEIDRLTSYLNDYKCKYRSLAKEPLDRQSYEIQIKQLFQRDVASRNEIDRLNKALNLSLATNEQSRRQIKAAQEKYDLLKNEHFTIRQRTIVLEKQLQSTRDNFEKYIKKSQGENYSLKNHINSSKIYTDSVVNNNKQLLAKVNTLPNYERRIFQLETQIKFYLEQLDRLNKDMQNRSQKLINQQRSYSTLYERHKNLENILEEIKRQNIAKKDSLEKTTLRISTLQGQNKQLKDQYDITMRQSTKVLSKRNDDIDIMTNKVKQYSIKITDAQKMIFELRTRLEEIQKLNEQKSIEIAQLRNDIQQKQGEIKQKISQVEDLKLQQKSKQTEWTSKLDLKLGKIHDDFQLKSKISSEKFIQQKTAISDELSAKNNEASSLAQKIEEVGKALQLSKGQTKISQQIVKAQEQQIASIKNQIEILKSTISQNQLLIKQLQSLRQELQQKLQKEETERKNLSDDFLLKNKTLQDQVEKANNKLQEERISLTKLINNKIVESETLKRRLIENENELRSQFESNFQANNKIHNDKMAKIQEQKQGLKSSLNKLKDQVDDLQLSKMMLQDNSMTLQTNVDTFKKQITDFEFTLNNERTVIQDLKTQIDKQKQELLSKQHQLQKLLKENDQLTNGIKSGKSENQQLKDDLNKQKASSIKFDYERSCYSMEIKDLKDQIETLQKRIENLELEKANLIEQNAKLTDQRGQLSSMFQNKTKENEGLKRKMIDLETELRDSFQQALKQHQNQSKTAYNSLAQQKEELVQKIASIEPHLQKLPHLQKSKEDLQIAFKSLNKNAEFQKTRVKTLSEQNETIRKNAISTQTKLKQYFESIISAKDQAISVQKDGLNKQLELLRKDKATLTADRDELYKLSTQYQAKTNLQMQQIERLHAILNNIISQSKSETDLLRSTNGNLQNQIFGLNQKITSAESQIETLRKSYLLITKRVTYYEQLISKLQAQFALLKQITDELKQQRDLLIKKNSFLIKSIRTLSDEVERIEKQSIGSSKYIIKDSSIDKQLDQHYQVVQDLLKQLKEYKIIEEKTFVITEVSSK